MATTRKFVKFTPVELEAQKDRLLNCARELVGLESSAKGINEKIEWLKNSLADLVRMCQEGGVWI